MADEPVHFADKLQAAVQSKKTPLIVGLDPRLERIPPPLRPDKAPVDGQTAAHLYQSFCCRIIDVVANLVPAVKPQAAFFEALGPHGTMALAEVAEYASDAGLLVIMDAKRGDIGSTAKAYAQAYLSNNSVSPWKSDALTVNPYLGNDTLQPFVQQAQSSGSGLYVLVKTSNPGSDWIQGVSEDGNTIHERVADHVQELSKSNIGSSGYGFVGAVVGATWPEQLNELRNRMPNVPFLVPGFGAQGGTAKDVAGAFDEQGNGAVVNSSRGIIFAYEIEKYSGAGSWQSAVEAATRDAIEQLANDTPAGKLRSKAPGQRQS